MGAKEYYVACMNDSTIEAKWHSVAHGSQWDQDRIHLLSCPGWSVEGLMHSIRTQVDKTIGAVRQVEVDQEHTRMTIMLWGAHKD